MYIVHDILIRFPYSLWEICVSLIYYSTIPTTLRPNSLRSPISICTISRISPDISPKLRFCYYKIDVVSDPWPNILVKKPKIRLYTFFPS